MSKCAIAKAIVKAVTTTVHCVSNRAATGVITKVNIGEIITVLITVVLRVDAILTNLIVTNVIVRVCGRITVNVCRRVTIKVIVRVVTRARAIEMVKA